MERSTDEVSGECKSKRIQEMHRRVCQIKASEKTEVKVYADMGRTDNDKAGGNY